MEGNEEMEKKNLLNTREVAELLDLNEKMVYSLIAEKGLPATKVTGKWLFPRHLVEQWLESQTINYPRVAGPLPSYQGILIIGGSNDILLDRLISLFNRLYPEHVAAFANLGSMGGLRALRRNLCHIASSHLLQENEQEYNFSYAEDELGRMPAVLNLCRREQGLLVPPGNPKGIKEIEDIARPGIRIVNRPLGTGTRLLFDNQLARLGIPPKNIAGYEHEMDRHMDVGMEVISGRADAGPGIRAVAGLLGLDFISWGWERFDLIALKERFFDEGIQLFLGLLHERPFHELAEKLAGYDLTLCGKMVYPQDMESTS
jgi:excisionase family DNA binding protein